MSLTCVRVLAVVAAAVSGVLVATSGEPSAAAVAAPPAHATFDYQIGGAYGPPSGVRVVTRDHTAAPAAGLYNICYVNAFQAQPGAEGSGATCCCGTPTAPS
ncbi:hypothetical protein GCM10029964_084170 [Kibdelosporangium lantanae]